MLDVALPCPVSGLQDGDASKPSCRRSPATHLLWLAGAASKVWPPLTAGYWHPRQPMRKPCVEPKYLRLRDFVGYCYSKSKQKETNLTHV